MLEDFFLLYFNETTKNNWTPDYFKITVLMERTGSVRYSNDNESVTHVQVFKILKDKNVLFL